MISKLLKLPLNLFLIISFFSSFLLGQGPIAQFNFDGNTNDSSGNGYTCVSNDLLPQQDRFGNINSAYYFNGTTSMITLDSEFALNASGSFTYCAWIQLDSLINTTVVFDRTSATVPMVSLLVIDSVLVFQARTDLNVYMEVISDIKIDNGWHWVCLQRNFGTSFDLLIDNLLVSQLADPGGDLTAPQLSIGASAISGGYAYMKGRLDDVLVYDRLLTNEEKDSIFNFDPGLSNPEIVVSDFEKFKLYPNPVNDNLTIQLDFIQSVKIYSIQGQNLYSFYFDKTSNPTISLLDLPDGTFIIEIVTSNRSFTEKIIKN